MFECFSERGKRIKIFGIYCHIAIWVCHLQSSSAHLPGEVVFVGRRWIQPGSVGTEQLDLNTL